MAGLSLDELDKHIGNLRAQLAYFNKNIEQTDHNAQDWLATDLVSLRNQSGRLHDEMKRFRDQLESEGLATKKLKDSHKRLSIEANQAPAPTPAPRFASPQHNAVSPLVDHSPTDRAQPKPKSTYVVQHVDVTEEVNRRLQENRLRRLMETPSTSHKRKFDSFEDTAECETGMGQEPESAGDPSGSPTKRLKITGAYTLATGKRKGDHEEHGGRFEDRTNVKRRKR